MNSNLRKRKGFYYVLEEGVIRDYMKIPPRARLQWLEDAYNFLMSVKDDKLKEIWQKFRRGEI